LPHCIGFVRGIWFICTTLAGDEDVTLLLAIAIASGLGCALVAYWLCHFGHTSE
jgi:hypothetical protein